MNDSVHPAPDAHAQGTAGVTVRPARRSDAEGLRAILNRIIEIGGTTAMETPLSAEAFVNHYLTGPHHVCCFVAEDGTGTLLGFQALEWRPELPEGCADVGTFARQMPRVPGVGAALFRETRRYAAAIGCKSINATIRADNVPGLAYYTKMGFKDHSVAKGVPLRDGTPVDRISKRYVID